MKSEMLMIRIEKKHKDAIKKQADKEKKSVAEYMEGLHHAHIVLVNSPDPMVICKCGQYTKRAWAECWNCRAKI